MKIKSRFAHRGDESMLKSKEKVMLLSAPLLAQLPLFCAGSENVSVRLASKPLPDVRTAMFR